MPRIDERVEWKRTGLNPTRLGFGTAPLGGLYKPLPDEDAHRIVERAWALGIRYFDTAPLYGYGMSERRLAAGLQGAPRDQWVLSTKVGRLIRTGIPRDPVELDPKGELFYQGAPPDARVLHDYSYDGVMRSYEESMQRLGTDRIDILFIHDPDSVELDPDPDGHVRKIMEGAYRAVAELREQGLVKGIGVGMNQVEMLVRFAKAGDFDAFLVAGRYTLLDQIALKELLPICVEKNIGIIIGGVYNSGILANPQPGAKYNYVDAPEELIRRAQQIKAVCDRYQVPLKAAAIQFPLGHPAVVSVLTGVRAVEELEENCRMFEFDIPDALWDELLAEGLLPEGTPVPKKGA